MKIVPYRVKFEVDLDSDTGKYRYSKPTAEMLRVEPTVFGDDLAYVISTHDRGDNHDCGPYYQVAFRIEDPSPYQLEELELRLDSAVFRNAGSLIKNDLFCEESVRNTPDNLWYQQSRYEYDKKKGYWKVVSDTDKKAMTVDCISTSGVFKIVVFRRGRLLSTENIPWVYVLPSSVSLQNYRDMLDDLINLHTSLIRNDASTIGNGEIIAIESDTLRIRNNIKITSEIEATIKAIMSLPSELQGKEYTQMSIKKVHHFDANVMKSYIRKGLSGRVLGVTYYEDHDTYENRIIKYILKRIKLLYSSQRKKASRYSDDIESAVQAEYSRRTKIRQASKPANNGQKRSFTFNYQAPREGKVPLSVKIDGNQVIMPRHAPFSAAGKSYIKLVLKAKTRRELLFYVHELANCFSGNTNNTFKISCTVTHTKKSITTSGNTIYEITIEDITSINNTQYSKDILEMSEIQFTDELLYLCRTNNIFHCEEYPQFYIIPDHPFYVGISLEEKEHMKDEIRAEYIRKKNNAIAFDNLLDEMHRLTELLSDPWFDGISDINGLSSIRPTAKFTMNRYYNTFYRKITEMMRDLPALSSDFEINAFGVIKTEQVFEYWVYYRILYQLQSMGFRINNQQSLVDNFRDFLESRGTGKKKLNCILSAKRQLGEKTVDVEIGYEHTFKYKKDNGELFQRTPDYFIHITTDGENHWYFMDAKYKSFSRDKNSGVNYLQEIYDVSLSKYIVDMSEVFSKSKECYGSAKNIVGSYIIMVDSDDSTSELSDNNRLFGGTESILADKSIDQWDNRISTEIIDNSTKGFPCHRYGAICLTPDHTDELQSLLELIFEYLEAQKQDDHFNLHFCWKCGSPQKVYREKVETSTSTEEVKYYKYYATCPQCKAFRSDNHCRSCGKSIVKHTSGNYHLRDDSVTSPQWAFICPDCGSPVNGFSDISESELDEIEKNTSSNPSGNEQNPMMNRGFFQEGEQEDLPF